MNKFYDFEQHRIFGNYPTPTIRNTRVLQSGEFYLTHIHQIPWSSLFTMSSSSMNEIWGEINSTKEGGVEEICGGVRCFGVVGSSSVFTLFNTCCFKTFGIAESLMASSDNKRGMAPRQMLFNWGTVWEMINNMMSSLFQKKLVNKKLGLQGRNFKKLREPSYKI